MDAITYSRLDSDASLSNLIDLKKLPSSLS